ncbi:MAG: VOC family protein [Gammaproteobacteria bacterium]|jgi:lactoylglutathione lyase|nr:VOC family protein [Rhodobacterales bacterium]
MRLGFINVFVSDLEAAIEFYTKVFGLTLIDAEVDHGYARFQSSPLPLSLEVTSDPSRLGRHTGIGLMVNDLTAAYEQLTERGASFPMPPTRQPWGGRLALVEDQDGNVFYLDQGEGHS